MKNASLFLLGLVCLTLTQCSKLGSGGDPVVAEYGGHSVKASEAFTQVKNRLSDLEEELYKTKEMAINEYIERKLLEEEAKKQKLTIDQLLEKETGATAVTEVSDKDVEAFLASKGLSIKDPRIKKEDVREYLKYRQKFEKRQVYVTKLREGANVKLKIQEPESAVLTATTEGFPTWGSAKAPVTIIEFSDFQCPYCSRAVQVIEQIKKEYGQDKIRLVFRDMPIPQHERARPASNAGHCANEQGKFWEMHNALFENQAKLSDSDLKEHAKTLGLDVAKFNECYDKKKFDSLIEKSLGEAEKLGLTATPSFLINGKLLQGAQPFEKFKERIDRALTKK